MSPAALSFAELIERSDRAAARPPRKRVLPTPKLAAAIGEHMGLPAQRTPVRHRLTRVELAAIDHRRRLHETARAQVKRDPRPRRCQRPVYK